MKLMYGIAVSNAREIINTAKGELPALTLLTDLTDIVCRRALPYLDVNLLLNIDIVRYLIILALAETMLFQILPWKNMMDIPPVFNHLLHTDVSRQEPFDLLLECQLCISLLFE